MFGTHHLGLFLVSALLLIVTPGQDTLYIVGRSLSQGRRAGVLSAFAITCGTAVHTLAAAYGLAAILATSAQAFMVIKLAGAAYLTYLGIRMIVDRATAEGTAPVFARASDWAVFRAGLLTNVLNPKVGIFYLAFLPQFIAPGDPALARSLLLAGLHIGIGVAWLSAVAFGVGRIRPLVESGLWRARLDGASGAVLIGLGIRLAAERR